MELKLNAQEVKIAVKNYIKAEFNKDAGIDEIDLSGSYGIRGAEWKPKTEKSEAGKESGNHEEDQFEN